MEMAGSAVQCPGCARLLQLPSEFGGSSPLVCQAIRIDVCECPQCRKGFGYTTQMLGTLVACPHCGSSFQLSPSGNLGKEAGMPTVQSVATTAESEGGPPPKAAQSPSLPAPLKAKKSRFRESESESAPLTSGGGEPAYAAKRVLPKPLSGESAVAPAQTGSAQPATNRPGPATPAGKSSSETPRIETNKSRRVEQPEFEIRIELAKPTTASGKVPRDEGAKVNAAKGETAKPDVVGKVGSAGVFPASALENSKQVSLPGVTPPVKARELGFTETPARGLEGPASKFAESGGLVAQPLPPEFSAAGKERGGFAGDESASAAVDVARLLPPRFYSSDPTIIRQPKSRAEPAFVLLPDPAGGFQRVNNTVIRIQHEGETIVLAAPDPARVRRRRWFVNLFTLIVCLSILYLAFRWLLN